MAHSVAKTLYSRKLYLILGPTERNNMEEIGTVWIMSRGGGDIWNWDTLHVLA